MPQLPRPCQRFSNGFEPIHLIKSEQLHRGLVRPINEDSYVILQEGAVPHWCSAVVGIFDGVGGLSNGLEASSRAARYLPELLLGPSLGRDRPWLT